MWRTLCRKIYFDWMGWKTEITVRPYDKCILCVAPHTSNWDFIVAELYYTAIGRRAEFLMKREWFFGLLACFGGEWEASPSTAVARQA